MGQGHGVHACASASTSVVRMLPESNTSSSKRLAFAASSRAHSSETIDAAMPGQAIKEPVHVGIVQIVARTDRHHRTLGTGDLIGLCQPCHSVRASNCICHTQQRQQSHAEAECHWLCALIVLSIKADRLSRRASRPTTVLKRRQS